MNVEKMPGSMFFLIPSFEMCMKMDMIFLLLKSNDMRKRLKNAKYMIGNQRGYFLFFGTNGRELGGS